jgi:hypothetical protein
VRIAIVADPALGEPLEAAGHEVVALEPPTDGGPAATALLAASLVEFERLLGADPVDAAVVARDGDADLALALVAAKQEVHLARIATSGSGTPAGDVGRAIALLANETMQPGAAPTIPG